MLFLSLIERSSLLSYFKLNRDILIRTLCLEVCFIFITFQGARLGDNVVAANAILMNFLLLISFGLDGIANATEAMVGKAKGEGDGGKLRNTVNVALLWTGLFAVFYSLIFVCSGEFLLTLISDIPSVVGFAKEYLIWMVVMPVIACWCYLFDGVYIGLMKAKAMRNSMVIATFVCFFPLWWLLNNFLPEAMANHALWAAFSFFMLIRGVTLAWHYHAKIK
jgi:MATE family multidrug resistance protein